MIRPEDLPPLDGVWQERTEDRAARDRPSVGGARFFANKFSVWCPLDGAHPLTREQVLAKAREEYGDPIDLRARAS